MASKQINIDVNSKSSGSGFKNAAKEAQDMGKEVTTVGNKVSSAASSFSKLGSTGSSSLSKITSGTSAAITGVGKLGTTAGTTGNKLGAMGSEGAKAGSNISKSMGGAGQAVDGLGSAIAGVAGGFGLMTIATAAWSGSTQAQFNKAYLATKVGNKAANDYVKSIQKIVSEVPGDDTFMNQILTGAVAKQTNLSNTELKALGNGVADYLAVSKSMGKSNIETQNDLNEYIKTGNTSQLERDSILKTQMGTLEGQETVSDRIVALNKALTAEGYAGLSQLDIASIKAEELKGKFQLTATELGNKILPYIERFLDFMLELDSKTSGQSTMWLLVGGAILAAAVAIGPMVWAIKQMGGGLKDMLGSFTSIGKKAKDFALPSKKKVKIDCEKDKDCNTSTTTGGKSTKSSKNSKSGSTIFSGLSNVGKAGVLINGIAIPGIVTIAAGNAFADSGSRTTSLNSKGQVQTSKTKTASDYTWTPGGKKVTGSKEPLISDKKVMDFLNSINPFKGTSANKKTNANTGNMDITKGWKLPTIKWPNVGQLLGSITGILEKGGVIPKINWPAVGSISAWIIQKIPKLNWKWPTMGSVSAWIRSKVPRLNWKWPTYSSIANYVQSKIGHLRFPNISWGSVASWIQSKIPTLNWPSGPGGYVSRVYSGAVSLYNKVKSALTPKGPGDGVDYNGLNLHYEDYPGSRKNAITAADCMSGNCVDMSLGLMAMNGGRGSLVMGTWNNGPHMWYKDPSGRDRDPARKALQNTWMPPARGPNNSNGQVIIQQNFQGGVYGDDYIKQVAYNAARQGANQGLTGNSEITGGY